LPASSATRTQAHDFRAGEVLVAPSTDPGWTPLFLRASAIAMASGGYLSHGAIVAREYAIPAVVNVPGILEDLRDGELLVVDGDSGRVIRESSAGQAARSYRMRLKIFCTFPHTEAEMRNKSFTTILTIPLLAGALFGQSASSLLTLDDSLRLALDHNRSIEQKNLSAKAGDDAIAAAKTQRLPHFTFSSTTGILLTRPTITFDRGAFGDYPGIGPIPGNTTNISSPRKPTALLTGEVALPLTQQRRIRLNIHYLELSKKMAQQQVRLTRQDVVKQVRQTYYAILQSQSSLDAIEQTLAMLREISDQTTQYVKVGTALEGDLLNVQARLAQAEYDKAALSGPLATQKETLNNLLGRPIETEFRVAPAVEANWIPALADARARALASRPEVQQARLKIEHAEVDRRKKQSEFIPDVSLAVTYYSAMNMSSSLPRNLAIAGVQATWEPFDWGRKRAEVAQKQKGVQEAAIACTAGCTRPA
jgi:outer membrane protein TolC/phosphohistidine swiveling domain-containing protein